MSATRREALGLLAASSASVTSFATRASAQNNSATKDGAGWRQLFNGRDLSGWTYFQEGVGSSDRDNVVSIDDGILHILGSNYRGSSSPGMGYLATDGEYGDYHLSLEYKWGERRYEPRTLWKRDSGILYHVPTGKDFLWPDCVEYQIMERSTGDAIPVNHRAIQGISLGGLPTWPNNAPGKHPYAPQIDAGGNLRQMIKADGNFDTLDGWNSVELIASGSSAAHIVNGRIVTTLYGLQQQDPADRSKYIPVSGGRILLQIECAEIAFRNIKIRSL